MKNINPKTKRGNGKITSASDDVFMFIMISSLLIGTVIIIATAIAQGRF